MGASHDNRRPKTMLLGVLVGIVLMAAPASTFAQSEGPLSTEQQEWLDERDRVVVLGSDNSYPPYVFFDPNGVLTGITADYVALLEQRLDITVEVRELPGFTETLAAAEAREIDIVPNVVASESRPYLVFTEPYVRAIDRIIVRSEDTSGGRPSHRCTQMHRPARYSSGRTTSGRPVSAKRSARISGHCAAKVRATPPADHRTATSGEPRVGAIRHDR